ncbi:lysozyme inhibitor LprI family protein [Sulfurospirillum sp.]|uniref:lysozyme inhibitor LprI family protein n=1 Tax=Sulfurospirillum sp. TaxID=2053622 RepID=UPI002FDEA89E
MKFLLTSLLFSSILFSASFDCSKATTTLEESICENVDLNQLDDMLGKKFFSIKKQLNETDVKLLQNEQKQWLKERTSICSRNDVACLINLYQVRINSLQDEYASKLQKNMHLNVLCNQIKSDFEQAIEKCVFDQDCISSALSKSASGLRRYEHPEVAVNNFGYTQIKTASAKTSAKGTSLVQLDKFQGDRFPRFRESRLVDSATLSEILSLPRKESHKRSDNAEEFQQVLDKGQKVSDYMAYLYYVDGVGDIVVIPDCEIETEYGAIDKCAQVNTLDVLLVYSNTNTKKICHFDTLEINPQITKIENIFLSSDEPSERLEALKKINTLSPDKQYKYNCIALNDQDANVRYYGIMKFRGPAKETIPLMLNTIIQDPVKDNRDMALFIQLTPPFTDNGADPCENFSIIEENLDLAFEVYDRVSYSSESTVAMRNLLGSGSQCCTTMKKENIERIYNKLASQFWSEDKKRYEQCLNLK